MARAKQLRPVDAVTTHLLAHAVRESGLSQATIGVRASMSQNRVGIILRGETPPATVGEVCAIASAVGTTGTGIVREAEATVQDVGLAWEVAALDAPGAADDDDVASASPWA